MNHIPQHGAQIKISARNRSSAGPVPCQALISRDGVNQDFLAPAALQLGEIMATADDPHRDESADDILSICDAYRALDHDRTYLEQRMVTWPGADTERDRAWQQLETILAQQSHLVAKLAMTASASLAELRAKAAVLACVVQPAVTDPGVGTPEMLKLGLTVAREAVALLGPDAGSRHQGGEQL